ncbi:MAG: PHP domain-containing protein [Lachnospiraceae bacterium]|nr:PHP domain-containing protein [Lachnospiraceae bacterium]
MIDLHIHSRYSDDGDFTPESLAVQCKEKGIGIFSVTDHNCVRANVEAEEAAKRLGLGYLSGGEFECIYNGRNFHMLGYGMDCRDEAFAGLEQAVERQSRRASFEMLEKTRALGFSVTEEEMNQAAADCFWKERWTGEMFGEVLLGKPEYENHPLLAPYRKGGDRSDNPYVNFYWDFYSQGKPCYGTVAYPPMEEVLEIIHRAGGIAVLAHPGASLKGQEEKLAELAAQPFDGIEVFSSYHCEKQEDYFLETAKRFGKLMTCGSDFHGKTKPAIHLGEAAAHRDGQAGEIILKALKEGGVL